MKKIIAFILALLTLMLSLPIYAENETAIYLSEGFSSYAENQTDITGVDAVAGVDTRVIKDGDEKVLFSRAMGDAALIKKTFVPSDDKKTVFSAKIKVTGEGASGKLFDTVAGANNLCFLNLSETGHITLPDGKVIGGMPYGMYRTYTVIVDWENQLCDVYFDKKCVAHRWLLPVRYTYSQIKELSFMITSGREEANLYIDDIRVYGGDTLPWEMNFPAEKTNDTVLDFTPTEEINEESEIVSQFEFEGKLGDVYIFDNGVRGFVSHKVDDVSGAGVCNLLSGEKHNGTGAMDVAALLDGVRKYVLDFKFRVNELSGSSTFRFLDAKNAANTWRNGYRANTSGVITSAITGGTIGKFEKGKWMRMSLLYNIPLQSVDVYLDGEYALTHNIGSDIYPQTFRFDIVSPVGSIYDVDLDYVRFYTGSKLLPESFFENSVNEGEETVVSTVPDKSIFDSNLFETQTAAKGGAIFMTRSDYMFIDGKKQSYKNDSFKPYIIDGVMMMPRNMLSLFSSADVQYDEASGEIKIGNNAIMQNGEREYILNGEKKELSSAPVIKDGTVYLPLRSVAEQILKMNVLWDDRGFVIVSNGVVEPTIPAAYLERYYTGRTIDRIHHYMQFNNPEGEEVIDALVERWPNKKHPRLLYTEDDIYYVIDKIEKDAEWKAAYDDVIKLADEIVAKDLSHYATVANNEKQGVTKDEGHDYIIALAEAYFFSGDAKYAKKGVEILKYFASWETTGFEVSNLTIGHWAAIMGIGYDSFYNYMNATNEGRETMKDIRDAVKRLNYAIHISKYSGGTGPHWVTLLDNFMGANVGGHLLLSLAVGDEEDIREESEYVIENILKSGYLGLSTFYPDGGYYEGLMYSEYFLTSLIPGIDALFNCCGTDYGLSLAKGFTQVGEPFTYLQTPDFSINYHDDGGGFNSGNVREFMAYRYGQINHAEIARIQKIYAGTKRNLKTLYYYDKAITDKGIVPDTSRVSLDAYIKGAETGGFKSSHTVSNPTFVGFHGGWTNIAHDMLDLGSFVFQSDNVAWARDIGKDTYSVTGYFGEAGYNIYRKNPEGENCVVINHAEDRDKYYGQKLGAYAPLIDFESRERGAKAAYDLSDAYERDVTAYKRGYYFGDDRNTLTVQDEMSLKKPDSDIYWFMHSSAKIEVIDNTHAKLTSTDGKICNVEVYCNAPGYEVLVMDGAPLPTSPKVDGMAVKNGSKLAVHIPKGNGDVVISVKLMPDNGTYEPAPLSFVPIDNWTIPEGSLPKTPSFTGIYADGELLPDFVDGKLNYEINVPYNAEKMPAFTATSDVGEIKVINANNAKESAKIVLSAPGYKTITASVKFKVSLDREINVTDKIVPNIVPKIGLMGNKMDAMVSDGMRLPVAYEGPEYLIDGNLTTLYSQDILGCWAEIDLGSVQDIKGTAIAWYEGDKRNANFDLLYSADGVNFEKVFSGKATGKTTDYESIEIPGKVRYIRVIGNGSNLSSWFSILEMTAYN